MNQKVPFEGDELYDQSKRAASILEHVLDEEQVVEQSGVAAEEARQETPVVQSETTRTRSRVLFVTSDVSTFVPNSAAVQRYVDLEPYFDEIHVLVVGKGNKKRDVTRAGSRVWLYGASSRFAWNLPRVARHVAKEALVFNESARPDVVVALNPYDALTAARSIAKAFKRPWQVHVLEDFLDPVFVESDSDGKSKQRSAKKNLAHAPSVRVRTEALKKKIIPLLSSDADIEVLPRFYNFKGYLNATPTQDVHTVHSQFVFVILTFARLVIDSELQDVLTALHRTLHNPRVGLVVVGDGPAKEMYKEKVKLLGIAENVVFLKDLVDPVSYFATSDVLIELDTTAEGDARVMRAAAAGLPILAGTNALREDLFEDGESAFLCACDDIECVTQKFGKFLNTPSYRREFKEQGKMIARDRLIEDPESYYRAYRDSIEVVLGSESGRV